MMLLLVRLLLLMRVVCLWLWWLAAERRRRQERENDDVVECKENGLDGSIDCLRIPYDPYLKSGDGCLLVFCLTLEEFNISGDQTFFHFFN